MNHGKHARDGAKKFAAQMAQREARHHGNDGSGTAVLDRAHSPSQVPGRASSLALAEALAHGGGVEGSNTNSLPNVLPGFANRVNPDSMEIGMVFYVDPKRVLVDDDQTRKQIDDEELLELAESIATDGQEEPAQVYRITDVAGYDWKVLHGERRCRAATLAEAKLLVLLRPEPSSRRLKKLAQMRSNKNRKEIEPLDEASAIQDALDEGATVEQIMRNCGIKARKTFDDRLRLLTLDPRVKAMMMLSVSERERLGVTAAVELSYLPREQQYSVALEMRNATIAEIRRAVRERTGKAEYDADEAAEVEELTQMIRETSGSNGSRRGRRKREPHDDYRLLRRFLEYVSRNMGHYAGLSQSEIDRLFQNRMDSDRGMALARAENAYNNLAVLINKIKKSSGRDPNN
ncbi:MAG: ParB/RepB/Spo0J family partition protein [Patescibacteria group bacterium]|jgi:ParB/RepB/Spo0J family partition protein|nr:ParB/RepB/Spo0J family partition protein [Patescibacteria group bacterium]